MDNGIPLSQHRQNEIDEYVKFGRPPKGFDKHDPERIRIFAERLYGIRMARNNQQMRDNNGIEIKGTERRSRCLAKDLASVLDISPTMISKYEKGKISAIPMDRIRRICVHYKISPHYLLGYVNNETDYLRLDEDGNIMFDGNGNVRVLHSPMEFDSTTLAEAVDTYRDLFTVDNELFWCVFKVISSSDGKRDAYKKIMDAFLKIK